MRTKKIFKNERSECRSYVLFHAQAANDGLRNEQKNTIRFSIKQNIIYYDRAKQYITNIQ